MDVSTYIINCNVLLYIYYCYFNNFNYYLNSMYMFYFCILNQYNYEYSTERIFLTLYSTCIV